MTPELLDLFCGAGGAGAGYSRAGFKVTGVDIKHHPDYPMDMIVGDALEVLADLGPRLSRYSVIHTSPPCPRYSAASYANPGSRDNHPDLIGPVRDALREWGGTYVIENVPLSPLIDPLLICGWGMGLKHIRRHRLFESNQFLMSPGCLCPNGDSVSVFGHSGEDRRKAVLRTHGRKRAHVKLSEVKRLMGVDWMTSRADVSDAIPPAYTEFIGLQLLGK